MRTFSKGSLYIEVYLQKGKILAFELHQGIDCGTTKVHVYHIGTLADGLFTWNKGEFISDSMLFEWMKSNDLVKFMRCEE